MRVRSVELLWPYEPKSGRKIDQMEVVVDLEDDTRWVSSFFDTARFNKGVQGFKGLGADRPFRIGPRLVIVRELTESTIRATIDALVEAGTFEEAFEKIGSTPPAE